jgi:NAD-dependent SIR2 family protein deacetylase
MIPITCPRCKLGGSVPDAIAGKKAKCPRCNEVFVAPGIATKDMVLPKGPSPSQSVHIKAENKSLTRWLILLAVAGSVMLGGCVILGLFFGVLAGSANNSRCILCGKEFYLSDEYRGNPSEFIVIKRCPRCDTEATPRTFFSTYAEAHGIARQPEK